MKKVKKLIAMGMAAVMLVTGIQYSAPEVKAAETETAETYKETAIDSVKFDVTVDGITDGDNTFEWNMLSTGWEESKQTVTCSKDIKEYNFTQEFSSTKGLKNLGYITVTGSALQVTVNKITINEKYELTFGESKTLTTKNGSNGLPNIYNYNWSDDSKNQNDGKPFCEGDNAYLAYDKNDDLIKFYVQSGSLDVETPITSVRFDVTVEGIIDEDNTFEWNMLSTGWEESKQTVTCSKDKKEYNFTQEFSSTKGLKNLGYITVTGSALQVTVNKITINEKYELTFGESKTLTTKNGSNGLPNIYNYNWSDDSKNQNDGKPFCEGDGAYLAYDATADLIKFYVKDGSSSSGSTEEGNKDSEEETKDPEEKPETPEVAYPAATIHTITYDVTVTGAAEDEMSFVWGAAGKDWDVKRQTIQLEKGNEKYQFTLDFGSTDGFIRLGYIDRKDTATETDPETDPETDLKVSVNSFTINDKYIFTCGKGALNKKDKADIDNIWWYSSSGQSDKIYTCEDAYLAYDADAGLIKFYASGSTEPENPKEETKTPEVAYPSATIYSITYDVTVTGAAENEKSFKWSAVGRDWMPKSQTIQLKEGEDHYQFTINLGGIDGFIRLGYIDRGEEENSDLKVHVNSFTINNQYTFTCGKDALKQKDKADIDTIWGYGYDDDARLNNKGKKIYTCDNAYLAYDGTLWGGNQPGLIKFYAESPEKSYVEAAFNSMKIDITVSKGDIAEGDKIVWKPKKSGGESENNQTIVVLEPGKKEYTITIPCASTQGAIDLGCITYEKSASEPETRATTRAILRSITRSASDPTSGLEVIVKRITINDSYVHTYEGQEKTITLSADGTDLFNILKLNSDSNIFQFENGYFAYDEETGLTKFYELKVNTPSYSYSDSSTSEEEKEEEEVLPDILESPSVAYVEAMGSGWNLGNSFDGFDADLTVKDSGETAWGNPVVTKKLIHAVKSKGYKSIRIPFTVYRRYTVNENASANGYKYVIDKKWLKRYKQVVDWATDEGLYVMINIHHDSWTWLKNWDGKETSEEYRMFCDFWKQLAAYMADESGKVCFETINEPTFEASGDISAQDKLDAINLAAYKIIRATKGNEKRMIVMPTMVTKTEAEYCEPLQKQILSLNDDHVIATVHYYSEWVYSANLGKTGFDEVLWDDNYTPRVAVDNVMKTMRKQFLSKGIGVIFGEYGLLGYDQSEGCLQTGEELKYYEYMNYKARENRVCLIFWDNGSGINRTNGKYSWKKEEVGKILESSMTVRSSYATGLDTLYFSEELKEDVQIPLTLNGNTFKGIAGLKEGRDYTYDASTAVVTLKKDYVNKKYRAASYGTFATLKMKFSGGADWKEYLVKCVASVAKTAKGTRAKGISIPVTFNGNRVKSVAAYQASGRVGPNSDWWAYLKYDAAFAVDYKDNKNGTFRLLNEFFADPTVKDGLTKIVIEYYSGQKQELWLNIKGKKVTSNPKLAVKVGEIGIADSIYLYAGETEIPSQYIQAVKGASVYGSYIPEESASKNNGLLTLEGWPAKMKFDTKAHAEDIACGVVLNCFDQEKYLFINHLGIKAAPVVSDITLAAAGQTARVRVSNLVSGAKVTYATSDPEVATVDAYGQVVGTGAGKAEILVTVQQYGRTDTFRAKIVVETDPNAPKA